MNEIPTPRSDSMEQLLGRHSSTRTMLKEACDFARTLERELTTAHEKLEATEKERDDATKQSDFYTERSVGAMTIAEGEEGHEQIPRDCPMLQAVSKLRQQFDVEKCRRLYYQGIVYSICNLIDKANHKRPGLGICCGTAEMPTTEVQTEAAALVSQRDTALAELAKVKAERDQQNAQAVGWMKTAGMVTEKAESELSRLRAENAAKDSALRAIYDAADKSCDSGVRVSPNWLHDVVGEALSTNPPVCVPVEVVAKLQEEITQLRGMLEKTLEAAAKACDENAERLAQDMDHRNKDHAKWWKRVQEMRALIRLAAPFLAKGDK